MIEILPILAERLHEHQNVFLKIASLFPLIEKATHHIVYALQNGGKVLLMGNGGSAADSQHLAAELIGRFKQERCALPALALTTDSSVLTSLSNDYDYSIVFARQIEALCTHKDVVIGLSTSGNSSNVLLGLSKAKELGAYTIGLIGHPGGKMAAIADCSIIVPATDTARIQEAHIFIGHIICECVERAFSDVKAEAAQAELV